MSSTTQPHKIVSPVDVEKRQNIDIQTGDTVRVVVKIPEGQDNFRLQPFEGIVLARKHGNEAGATFTVRRTVAGVGVEKIFPLYSPRIDEISIVRRAKTRRSKLYHIRDKAARQIRRQMRKMIQVDISTGSALEQERAAEEEEEAKKQAEAEAEAKEAEEPAAAEADDAQEDTDATVEESEDSDGAREAEDKEE